MVSCWVVILFIKGFIIFYFKNVTCRLEFISLEHSLINLRLINLIQYLMYKVEKENVNCSFRSLGILPVHSGVLKLKIFLKNFFLKQRKWHTLSIKIFGLLKLNRKEYAINKVLLKMTIPIVEYNKSQKPGQVLNVQKCKFKLQNFNFFFISDSIDCCCSVTKLCLTL